MDPSPSLLKHRSERPPAPLYTRAPQPHEWETLCNWLDDGLRSGERGRLLAEYPISMRQGASRHHCRYSGKTPIAHSMLFPTALRANGHALDIGLIGNVYTDPDHRGRGHAAACIQACIEDARALGMPLVLLWSELESFYSRLGFHPCGRERFLTFDAKILGEAMATARRPSQVRRASAEDFPALEALYAQKTVRTTREAGDLARLAAAPETELLVAQEEGALCAYVARGRGLDFQGVAHEWAGTTGGILACLGEFARDGRPITALAGPGSLETGWQGCLLSAGAALHQSHFALAHLLDARPFWEACWEATREATREASGETRGTPAARLSARSRETLIFEQAAGPTVVETTAALALLFEGHVPPGLPAPLSETLGGIRPWPLYLWGFDSI